LGRSVSRMKMGLYARVSTHDQQTLALQQEAMVAYARQRGGSIVMTVEEVGSGVSERLKRDALMRAARRRDIDMVVVWRLDRWGRSLADLVNTLQELQQLGVGFISLRNGGKIIPRFTFSEVWPSSAMLGGPCQRRLAWAFCRLRSLSVLLHSVCPRHGP